MFDFGLRFVVEGRVAKVSFLGLDDGFQEYNQRGELRFSQAINQLVGVFAFGHRAFSLVLSSVRVLTVQDAVDGDGIFGFIEDHAMIADAEPEQPLEVTAEGFDTTRASFGVAMDGFEDVQGGFLFDSADLFCDVGPKADPLHAAA
jgi:hypothetical protein